MRLVILLSAVGLLALNSGEAAAAKHPKQGPDLILRAKVTKIFISPLPRSHLNFVIQTRVLRVLKGRFTGKRFDFRVHSPTKSNLRVGYTITIEAYRVPGGYRVPFKRY
jgi:hypothetical protein